MMLQLGDEDCILPSKLQAALQQVLEERELILGQEAEPDGAGPGGQSRLNCVNPTLSSLLWRVNLPRPHRRQRRLTPPGCPCRPSPDGGEQLSALVSEAFVRLFVELVGHYPLHMAEASAGARELQRDAFRKSHPSRGVRQFLQLFMETQMFAGFIQDKELRKGGAGAGKGRRGQRSTPSQTGRMCSSRSCSGGT